VRKYHKMLNASTTVRIAGIHVSPAEKGPVSSDPLVPKRFREVSQVRAATFVRLQTKDQCKAYFDNDCELPEYYWAGTNPQ